MCRLVPVISGSHFGVGGGLGLQKIWESGRLILSLEMMGLDSAVGI